jgi:hypothetical protein
MAELVPPTLPKPFACLYLILSCKFIPFPIQNSSNAPEVREIPKQIPIAVGWEGRQSGISKEAENWKGDDLTCDEEMFELVVVTDGGSNISISHKAFHVCYGDYHQHSFSSMQY